MKKSVETITIGVLLLVVIVLGIFSINSEFKVSGYEVNQAKNSISVFFSEPVQKDVNLKDFVSISPESDFKVNNLGNKAEIIFEQILLGQKYDLRIDSSLVSLFGTQLRSDTLISFSSKSPRFAFFSKEGDTSYIKSYDIVEQKEVTLYSTSNTVKGFSIRNKYLLVNELYEEVNTKLVLIDLDSRNVVRTTDLKARISFKADLSYDGSFFVYMSQSVKTDSDFVIPVEANNLNMVNIQTGENKEIEYKKFSEDVLDIFITPDNSALLIRGYDSTFFIQSFAQNDEPVTLSKFIGTGGFDSKGTKVIFAAFDPTAAFTSYPFITVYNSDRTTNDFKFDGEFVTDPIFYGDTAVMYAKKLKDIVGTPGIFGIFTFDAEKETAIVQSDTLFESFELPKLSSDEVYMCYESYSQIALLDFNNQRNFINQRKPSVASLNVMELDSNESIVKIDNAYDCKWY